MSKEVYNKQFEQQGAFAQNDPARFSKIASLCGKRVLDVGCGVGLLSDHFLGDYVGVDFSDVAVGLATKHRRKNAAFLCRDITNFNLAEIPEIDTVVFGEVLEHFSNDEFDIAKFLAPLKGKGRVVVSVPNMFRVPDSEHKRVFGYASLRKMFSPLGYVKFYNWPGEHNRIIMTCDLGCFSEPMTSLVMVVKNEEMGLENAVNSAIELVDDVVIFVDNKSTDKSWAIAQLLADTAQQFEWPDDFSKARNMAQEKAKGEWVISLDGHEYISEVKNLKQEMTNSYDCLWCQVKYENGLTFAYPRVFRKKCQWKDAVHNLIQCQCKNKKEVLKIIHDREHLQSAEAIKIREQQRDEMIVRIMSDRLKKNKNDFRARFYLAVHLQASSQLKPAIEQFKKYIRTAPNSDEKWFAYFNLAVCHMRLGHMRRAFYYAQSTENVCPGRWENAHLCGNVLMTFKRYKHALPYLAEALKDNPRSYMFYPIIGREWNVFDMMSLCLANLGQYQEAFVAMKKAVENCKDDKKKKELSVKLAALGTICSITVGKSGSSESEQKK